MKYRELPVLYGRRVNVRHSEFVLGAIDGEASKKSISMFLYGNCNYFKWW